MRKSMKNGKKARTDKEKVYDIVNQVLKPQEGAEKPEMAKRPILTQNRQDRAERLSMAQIKELQSFAQQKKKDLSRNSSASGQVERGSPLKKGFLRTSKIK